MTLRPRPPCTSLLASSLTVAFLLTGCGDADTRDGSAAEDGAATETAPGAIHLEASADLFADASFDGHVEATAPGVVATIDVEAWGSATVDARVVASATDGGVLLEEARGRSEVTIEGGLSLEGQLVVDLPGLEYEGPIPGLENHELVFESTGVVDVLSSSRGATRTELPAGERPGLEVPGIDGGRVVVGIGEGSFVETHLVADCASADEATVEVRARLVTSGRLVVRTSLEFDAPLIGTEALALAEVEVTIHGETSVVMTASVDDLASQTTGRGADLPSCN